jgi:hypothetical protein
MSSLPQRPLSASGSSRITVAGKPTSSITSMILLGVSLLGS